MTASLPSYVALDDSHDNTKHIQPLALLGHSERLVGPRVLLHLNQPQVPPSNGNRRKALVIDYDSNDNWPTDKRYLHMTTGQPTHGPHLNCEPVSWPSAGSSAFTQVFRSEPHRPTITIQPTTSYWLGWLAASVTLH